MYDIEFYEKENGYSDVWIFLEVLRKKAPTSKDARIMFNQMIFLIELLQNKGTHLPENYTKLITEDIWELRPGKNRVLYFFFGNNTFVLLHHFAKKHKRLLCKKSRKQNVSAMITSHGKETNNNENMECLQGIRQGH